MLFRLAASALLITSSAFFLADAQGGSPIKLVSAPSMSSDGSQIAFAWRGDIWLVPVAGGTAHPLTVHEAEDSQPVFSPDGKQVAFISNRTGSNQVFVISVDGGGPRQLTYHTEGYSLEEWYPDGRSLLTQANRDNFWRHGERFFTISSSEPRSGERLLFDAYGSDATISPDGKTILFAREGTRWWRKGYRGSQASQIWSYTPGSKKFQKIVEHPTGCRSPMWHPSGEKFYYVSGQSGAFNLWQHDLKSDHEIQLTEFPDDSVVFPAISRDGSVIVFRHLFDLYTLHPEDGKGPQKIDIDYEGDVAHDPVLRRTLDSATDVAFSSDGLEVAFISGGDVWVMDTELREPKQVTDTAEEERDVLFAPDNKSIVFISDKGEQCDIWSAHRGDEKQYWWQNDEFTLKQLTDDSDVEESMQWSPVGDRLAFVKSRGDLWVMNPDGNDAKRVFSSWNVPEYDWSPDGKWFVYALSDDDFNQDIYLAPVDGSREPFNLSMHPDNDDSPVWSPDGSMIAYTGRHISDEVDIYYVYLQAAKNDESSRDRTLKEAIEKMQKGRKKSSSEPGSAKKEEPKPDEPAQQAKPQGKPDEPAAKADAAETKKKEAEKPEEDSPKVKPVEIDFEGIHDRIHRISIPDSREQNLFWSHDSKKLAFTASIDRKTGTYTVSFPDELKPKLLTSDTGSRPVWIKTGNQILWLHRGVPASLSAANGKSTAYSFSARQATDVGTRFETAFMQCWRSNARSFLRWQIEQQELGCHLPQVCPHGSGGRGYDGSVTDRQHDAR